MYVEKTVTIHDEDDIVIKVEPYSSKELKITASQSNYAIYISPNKLGEILSQFLRTSGGERMKLYEHDEALESMYRAQESANGIDEETGMVFDIAQLDAWEKERDEKIEHSLLYSEQLKADAKEIDDYIRRLTARAKAKKNAAESIKNWLIERFKGEDIKKFETKRIRATLSVRAASKTVITDENLIPPQYIRTKFEPDTTAIKAAIKAGEEVPGAILVDSVSLTVK